MSPTEHTHDAAQQAVLGNFQLTAQLPDGKQFNVSGYLFSGESIESLNQRLDLLHGVVDRQRTLAEIPELEKKMDAAVKRLAEYRGFCDALVAKQQAVKAKGSGPKVTLSSQEKQQLDVMDINIKKLLEDIEEGKRTIAEARAKVGIA